jgi:hypothetical protein
LSRKRVDFELFKEIVKMVINKDHLTKEGIEKIVYLRASMNMGLSESLKKAFSKYKDNLINKNIDKEEKGISDPN